MPRFLVHLGGMRQTSAPAACSARWPVRSRTRGVQPRQVAHQGFHLPRRRALRALYLYPVRRGLVHARLSGGRDRAQRAPAPRTCSRTSASAARCARSPVRSARSTTTSHRQGHQVRPVRRRSGLRQACPDRAITYVDADWTGLARMRSGPRSSTTHMPASYR
jgi:hypothetical protein